ncbi:MAG TPA: class I SAM-dependent methyltransferase, partial [Verrucomicrobiae bacterium]|nr:class I SAM-dependent methyltransferase [Verrucomicrobiae bacterium]
KNKVARIFNMGCGPAKEIQDFLRHRSTDQRTDFTLVDFNDETLAYTSKTLSDIARKYDSPTEIRLIKKSVNQLIKEAFKLQSSSEKYDIVYCAGLFDYLSDPICKKLLNVFYDLVAPGGLLIATNVDDSNPSKGWMEFVLDWHLVYRNGSQFAHLRPDAASSDDLIVRSVGTGVNIFLEVRKPENVR